MHEIA